MFAQFRDYGISPLLCHQSCAAPCGPGLAPVAVAGLPEWTRETGCFQQLRPATSRAVPPWRPPAFAGAWHPPQHAAPPAPAPPDVQDRRRQLCALQESERYRLPLPGEGSFYLNYRTSASNVAQCAMLDLRPHFVGRANVEVFLSDFQTLLPAPSGCSSSAGASRWPALGWRFTIGRRWLTPVWDCQYPSATLNLSCRQTFCRHIVELGSTVIT